MKILVLNAGSSSHKLCLYSIDAALPEHPPERDWVAQIDWYPQRDEAIFEVKTKDGRALHQTMPLASRRENLAQVLSTLWQGPTQVIQAPKDIDIVGHRVVHGGQTYRESVLVTPNVKEAIAQLIPLAPSLNPANLEGIQLMEELLENIPQVAVFDTAFHSHMPMLHLQSIKTLPRLIPTPVS